MSAKDTELTGGFFDFHQQSEKIRPKDDIEAKAAKPPEHPKLYRAGRMPDTREMVVRSNCVVIYTEDARAVTIPARAARGAAVAARKQVSNSCGLTAPRVTRVASRACCRSASA